jgi:hypothetical protein
MVCLDIEGLDEPRFSIYSIHPNTEPLAVFGLNLMPVSIIRVRLLALTVLLIRVIKNILFMPKRSRLAEIFWSRFQMVEKKWPPFCFYHSKSGFRMVGTSLDRFIKKRVPNKIFFMPKQSRLVRKISGPDFEWIRKLNTNCVRKATIRKLDGSVFGGVLYIKWSSLAVFHGS